MNENERDELKEEIHKTYEEILDISDTSPEKASDYILKEFKKDLDDILKESETISNIEKYSMKRHYELSQEENDDIDDDEIEDDDEELDNILNKYSIFFNE